jgi:hypothetical protein
LTQSFFMFKVSDMTYVPDPDKVEFAKLVSSAIPNLLKNLNSNEAIPWASTLTRSELDISVAPKTFIDGKAFASGAKRFQSLVTREDDPEKVIHGELVGSRLVIIGNIYREKPFWGHLTYFDKKAEILGLASIEFNAEGDLLTIYEPSEYVEGDFLNRKSGEYLTALLTSMLLRSAEDVIPTSGWGCFSVNGVKIYDYKKSFDVNGNYVDVPILLSAKSLPKVRNDLAKELKGYTQDKFKFDSDATKYFSEISKQIYESNEMWWVSEDMTKLAWDVAMSDTGPEDLDDTELPTRAGVMWLNGGGGPVLTSKRYPDENFLKIGDTPTDYASVNAIIWYSPTVSIKGIEIGKTRFMSLTAHPDLVRDSTKWNSIISALDLESNEIEYYRIPTYATIYSLKGLPRKVALTVMRLAREESVGEKASESFGGSSTKKKSRNKSIETVTCASLRRHRYISEEEKIAKEKESREYSHRWIVRGHMRKQPVGPRLADEERKYIRIWIAPFVKGPDDKPLVLKDRVQLFTNASRELEER